MDARPLGLGPVNVRWSGRDKMRRLHHCQASQVVVFMETQSPVETLMPD